MISLYFNCKITGVNYVQDTNKYGYFYPIVNPKSFDNELISQYEILIKTLVSYRFFKFKTAILNIELEDSSNILKNKEVEEIIKKNISAETLVLNFYRPSTVDDWKKNIKLAMTLIPKNTPVLLCMNHDHPYVDYSVISFFKNLNEIFKDHENNFKKIFYYSMAAEVTSWINNKRDCVNFKKYKLGLYQSNKIQDFVDSFCVMTLETLYHIWENIMYEPDYIGRIDWLDVFYADLNLTAYAFPREYFKHYDGYVHTTGMRIISDIKSEDKLPLKFPENESGEMLVKFYYQKWIDTYIISIRDALSKSIFKIGFKKNYLKEVEKSLELMNESYFLCDLDNGLINEKQYSYLKEKLRNYIYYMSNNLIIEIYTDITLSQKSFKKKIAAFLPASFVHKIKIIKKNIFGINNLKNK